MQLRSLNIEIAPFSLQARGAKYLKHKNKTRFGNMSEIGTIVHSQYHTRGHASHRQRVSGQLLQCTGDHLQALPHHDSDQVPMHRDGNWAVSLGFPPPSLARQIHVMDKPRP